MNKCLNILLITARSDVGGGPRHVKDLAKNLSNSFKVFIASPKDLPYYIQFKDFPFVEIPHRKFSLIACLRLLFFCKKNDIRLIHSHGQGASIYSFFLSLWGYEIIHTFHGVHLPNSRIEKLKAYINRFIARQFKEFIFVSKSEMKHSQHLQPLESKEHNIIPNGVCPEEIKEKTINKTDARKKFKLPENGIILGILSRLDPHKNNENLISWCSRFPDNFFLAIAGEGESRKLIEQKIKSLNLQNKVFLLGEINDPEVFLSAIDLYISNSKGEGLPYSVLEAMALDIPVLLSRVSGHIDLVSEDNLFYNEETFLKKLPTAIKRIVPIDNKYSIPSMVKSIEAIYLRNI